MDTSIKTEIETFNTSGLFGEFTDMIIDSLAIVIPVVGGIFVTILIIKLFRRFLNV